jgi:hypothetical protein
MALQTELTAIRNLVHSARLTEQEKQTANWFLGHLPRLYQDFGQTYDSGLRLKILGLQRGVVGLVGKHVAGLQQHFDALNQVMGVEPDRVKRNAG